MRTINNQQEQLKKDSIGEQNRLRQQEKQENKKKQKRKKSKKTKKEQFQKIN